MAAKNTLGQQLPDPPRLRVLSLGGGWQSSTLALMSARGDLPPLDMAIFADTGGESRAVYEYLDWLEGQVPFPLIRARRPGPDLATLMIGVANGLIPREGAPLPPFFTANGGSLARHCSKEFKTRVVIAKIRETLGLAPGERGPKEPAVEQWIGMTTDEAYRVKPCEVPWIISRWPLIELGMKRRHCRQWLQQRQYRLAPKSACTYCPYHDDDYRRDLRDNAPDDWARAVEVDRLIRPGIPGEGAEIFVHPQRVPLDQADLSTDAERGQPDLWPDECEGICGS